MTSHASATSNSVVRSAFVKVPEVTAYFWIIKVLSTTVGETFADYLSTNLNFGEQGTLVFMGALLAASLGWQFALKRYFAPAYWLSVVLISVTGTLVTDNMVDHWHVTLVESTITFAVLLTATFVWWYRAEGTLSIHSIDTVRREAFYWLTILFTFALGTAAGDLFAERIALGYFASGVIFAGVIALVSLAWRAKALGNVATFWAAYVVTRPLGASIGDFLSQPKSTSGIGLGTTTTSLIFLSLIVALVAFLAITRRDAPKTGR
mgnify:CR=1 FL=1